MEKSFSQPKGGKDWPEKEGGWQLPGKDLCPASNSIGKKRNSTYSPSQGEGKGDMSGKRGTSSLARGLAARKAVSFLLYVLECPYFKQKRKDVKRSTGG